MTRPYPQVFAGMLAVGLAFFPTTAAVTMMIRLGVSTVSGAVIPTWQILGLLIATIGLPYLLLSSTSPLLHEGKLYMQILQRDVAVGEPDESVRSN